MAPPPPATQADAKQAPAPGPATSGGAATREVVKRVGPPVRLDAAQGGTPSAVPAVPTMAVVPAYGGRARPQVPLPPLPEGVAPEVGDAAFQAALIANGLVLSPEQIREIKRVLLLQQHAAVSPVVDPPTPVTRSAFVSLQPGRPPETIRTYDGHVTTVVFSDQTGAPWPIASVVPPGTEEKIDVKVPVEDGNQLTLVPLKPYLPLMNVVVFLKGLDTPVIMSLAAGGKEVDYRVDIHIQSVGPNPRYLPPTAMPAPVNGDKAMMAFLDGVPPKGAVSLSSGDSSLQAWQYGGQTYLRTTMSLLSPQATSLLAGAGDMKVWMVEEVPLLLMSDNGRLRQVRLGDAAAPKHGTITREDFTAAKAAAGEAQSGGNTAATQSKAPIKPAGGESAASQPNSMQKRQEQPR